MTTSVEARVPVLSFDIPSPDVLPVLPEEDLVERDGKLLFLTKRGSALYSYGRLYYRPGRDNETDGAKRQIENEMNDAAKKVLEPYELHEHPKKDRIMQNWYDQLYDSMELERKLNAETSVFQLVKTPKPEVDNVVQVA